MAMKLYKIFFLASVLLATLVCSACRTTGDAQTQSEIEELYDDAVVDAMIAETDEVLPLVELTPEDDLTNWNDEGEVLLVTWHSYPDSYVEGETITLEYGHVWTFTDKEIIDWYKENEDDEADYKLRFEQLIGLPPADDKTHFTALWVNPDDVWVPAYDIEHGINGLPEDEDPEFAEWFDDNIIGSYFGEYKYPWTRLGYTFDWADNDTEYGLSEFLILNGSSVEVEYTKTTEEFLLYMDEMI